MEIKSPLDELYEEKGDEGLKGSMDDSIKWFKKSLEEIQDPEKPSERPQRVLNRKKVLEEKSRFVAPREMIPGSMYMYYYDPKTKESLPYYDQFPLILCLDVSARGFTGLNLHYLRPTMRFRLFEALKTRLSNRNYDEKTRVLISYQTLRAASKYRFFKPCYKQYLTNHVISKVKYVHPSEWENSIMLPNESFVGLRTTTIWKISEGMIR